MLKYLHKHFHLLPESIDELRQNFIFIRTMKHLKKYSVFLILIILLIIIINTYFLPAFYSAMYKIITPRKGGNFIYSMLINVVYIFTNFSMMIELFITVHFLKRSSALFGMLQDTIVSKRDFFLGVFWPCIIVISIFTIVSGIGASCVRKFITYSSTYNFSSFFYSITNTILTGSLAVLFFVTVSFKLYMKNKSPWRAVILAQVISSLIQFIVQVILVYPIFRFSRSYIYLQYFNYILLIPIYLYIFRIIGNKIESDLYNRYSSSTYEKGNWLA